MFSCENDFCKCDDEPVLIYEAHCSVTDNYLFSVHCHKECVKDSGMHPEFFIGSIPLFFLLRMHDSRVSPDHKVSPG